MLMKIGKKLLIWIPNIKNQQINSLNQKIKIKKNDKFIIILYYELFKNYIKI